MLYGLAGIVSFVGVLLSWWSFRGPYRWVSELQSWAWGIDWMQLSFVVSWAGLYLPLHAVADAWQRRHGRPTEPITWQRFVAGFNFLFEQRPGQVTGVGIIVFTMGGWFWLGHATSGPLTSLTMAAADRGERPGSRHVRLTGGRILLDSELTFTRNRKPERYFPVVSDATRKLRVFARLDGKYVTSPPAQLEGELIYDGLPGPLRARLADEGSLAPDHFVLHHGRDPTQQAAGVGYMAAFGALLMTTGLVWTRARRRAPAASS
jgi:hypothetical protein